MHFISYEPLCRIWNFGRIQHHHKKISIHRNKFLASIIFKLGFCKHCSQHAILFALTYVFRLVWKYIPSVQLSILDLWSYFKLYFYRTSYSKTLYPFQAIQTSILAIFIMCNSYLDFWSKGSPKIIFNLILYNPQSFLL